jgi:hypothetical protein
MDKSDPRAESSPHGFLTWHWIDPASSADFHLATSPEIPKDANATLAGAG